MSRKPERRCQCRNLGERCDIDMTAEDLLCDTCRDGCNAVFILDPKMPNDTIMLMYDASSIQGKRIHLSMGDIVLQPARNEEISFAQFKFE